MNQDVENHDELTYLWISWFFLQRAFSRSGDVTVRRSGGTGTTKR